MKNLLALALILLSTSVFAQSKTKVENVDAATFKKHIDEKKGVLIDLRTDGELEAKGTIKGAVQIDYLAKDSEVQISKLDRKKTYLIYCAAGGRSSECVELMQKQGFAHVIHLEKGFDDWRKKGFETVAKPAK